MASGAASPGPLQYHNWIRIAREHGELTLGVDVLLRLSAVLGIHQALGILFQTEGEGVGWLRAPHAATVFGGRPPIELILSGGQDGLLTVRRFLDAARAGSTWSRTRRMPVSSPIPTPTSSSGDGGFAPAPQPTHRLIPSRFPPIGLFETVTEAADLEAVMELAGWTNDRLVTERVRRLPRDEWVYGRPNASIVMAAFLHSAPSGGRFSAPELGAWYAAAAIETAAAEVGHHLRREAVARRVPEMRREFRQYAAHLAGSYRDIRGLAAERPELYAPDSYAASQIFGERVRAAGEAGILYDSVRHAGGVNVVAHRPRNVLDVVQADHFEIGVTAVGRTVEVRRLGSGGSYPQNSSANQVK